MEKNDLIILKLLRIPVAIISFMSRTIAMLTYIPNYFILLGLDSFLFHEKFASTLGWYAATWVFRFVALLLCLAVFVGEISLVYYLTEIYYLHWMLQIPAMLLATSGLLFLMRKGYLSMISKFNPTKLKSPLEHLHLALDFILDILSFLLAVVNIIFVLKARNTLRYRYDPKKRNYLPHILHCLHQSILECVKLFYVKVFFRLFPWRYTHSLPTIQKQDKHILNLFVLLTLLFLYTLADLFVIGALGLYGIVHPRRKLFLRVVKETHEKWKAVLKFIKGSAIQNIELMILLFCLPFKKTQSITLMKKIINAENYNQNHLKETIQVLKLALVKIPSLYCVLILRCSVYKYKKYKMMLDAPEAAPKEYVSFQCFSSLWMEIPYWFLVPVPTFLKPWNIKWLAHLINNQYDLEKGLITEYFMKCITDTLYLPFTIFMILVVAVYEPVYAYQTLKIYFTIRSEQKQNPHIFYTRKGSIVRKLLKVMAGKFQKDFLYFPMYIILRVSGLSVMKCPHPSDSAEFIQFLILQFYISRVKRRKDCNKFMELFEKDEAAGLIKGQKQKLRFWKFAFKICRIKTFCTILGWLMPGKFREKILSKIKEETRFSSISNEYWTNYGKMIALIKGELYLLVNVILTVFGLAVMLPLTLWRMPTFLILWKAEKWKKKQFFPLLFQIYKRMFFDLLESPVRTISFVLFPRHMVRFYRNTALRYESELPFDKLQKIKYQYIERILLRTLESYGRLLQIIFIKVLWVRAEELRNEMQKNKVRTLFLLRQMCKKVDVPSNNQQLEKDNLLLYEKPVEEKLRPLIDVSFEDAGSDIPYLALMILLLFTLPWRVFHIVRALKMMKENKENRKQFQILLGKILKDYESIFLYLLLFLSIVKTKRAMRLFIRNVKLNFFVGFLRYSHLKELRKQVKQAGLFYFDVIVMGMALLLSPYRVMQIKSTCINVFTKHQKLKKVEKQNRQIYQNTVKSGKELQLLTKMGYQCFISTCQYLTTPELIKLTCVSHFTYDMIRDRDEVWQPHWERLYLSQWKEKKNPSNFNEACVSMYQKMNKNISKYSTFFHEMAVKQLFLSSESQLDVKVALRNIVSEETHNKIFHGLRFTIHDGYGREQLWPQPGDNEEYLQLMNIVRRDQVELDEPSALTSWLFQRPVEQVMAILNRFYTMNTHRRKKQLLWLLMIGGGVGGYPITIYFFWSQIWHISSFIGVKVLIMIYLHFLIYLLGCRFDAQSRGAWEVVLTPFNLVDDVVSAIRSFIATSKTKIQAFFRFSHRVISKFVVRPLKWVGNTFVERIGKPLYLTVSKGLKDLWKLAKKLWQSVKVAFGKIGQALIAGWKGFIRLMANINGLYYGILKSILRFFLRWGTVGELIFTLLVIGMISLPLTLYFLLQLHWLFLFIVFTLVLILVTYRHLNKIKNQL